MYARARACVCDNIEISITDYKYITHHRHSRLQSKYLLLICIKLQYSRAPIPAHSGQSSDNCPLATRREADASECGPAGFAATDERVQILYLRKLRGPSVWMAAGSCHCTGSIRNIGTKLQMRASLEANEPLNYATAEQRIEIGGAEQRHCACVHRRSSQVNWKIPIDRKLLDMFSIELEILG